ncbi:ABC transporter ATP-binding protein [Bacteroidia bacterium]|nr:ABC transporter ATP-binding protein [Bacteroidia bacterium]
MSKNIFIFDPDWWQEISITITKNKSRSILTAFGVFWGMFMLVVMVGAGGALENGIMGETEGMATNSCFFWANRTSVPYKGFRKDRQWNLKMEDYLAVKQQVKNIEYVSPRVSKWDVNVVRGDKTGTYAVAGYLPEYNNIMAVRIIQGRYINEIDVLEKRKVCVIGKRIYEEMFGKGKNVIGQLIQVNGIYFQIIGVGERISESYIGSNPDETVIAPLPTVQQIFNMGNVIYNIAVTAKPDVEVAVVQQAVTDIITKRNNISPDDTSAVGCFNLSEMFKVWQALFIGVAALVWIVGLGTLIAGGIGISNIMLVTVRERTKEIGIRRALGATPRNIIIQIMSESIVLTAMAGIAGLMFGVGVLQLVSTALSQSDGFFKNPQISFGVSIGALVILLVIGTVAGYMPARRAMRIKPIEAIREE